MNKNIEHKIRNFSHLFFVACNFLWIIWVLSGSNLKHNKWKAQIVAYSIQPSGRAAKPQKWLRLALPPSYFCFLNDPGRLKVKAQNCFHQPHKFRSISCTVLIAHRGTTQCRNPDSPAAIATCWFRMNWIVGLSLRKRWEGLLLYLFFHQFTV